MINKTVLRNIYNHLTELSSTELQISYWIKGDKGKISSFIELINSLEDDDFNLFVDKEASEMNLSAEFARELKILRGLLNNYDESNKTRIEIINDPKWKEIGKHAQHVLIYWRNEIGDLLDEDAP
ncbi:MAG: hypothetical protein BGO54_02275 [Sphingobacteriales bacterium 46-32]|mgnify:CR=1 FL=1|nr:MAG: hypothetical protein BGO54_02275 [Sphingobacteriales bacterium 46-32]